MDTKDKLIAYIKDNYGAEEEHLWSKFPDYSVFRHKDNNKWFAAILKVKKRQLGLESDEEVYIVDLKGAPAVNGSLRLHDGIFAGYHMNKEYWISVLLDASVDFQLICDLVDLSFQNTKK